MELSNKDKVHLIETGYKKLANSISRVLKDPKKENKITIVRNLLSKPRYIFLRCQQNQRYQSRKLTHTS